MKYIMIPMGSYNLHLINEPKFKEINIYIDLKRKVKKEEVTIRNFLSTILLESTNKYLTNRLLAIETEELYGASIGSGISINADVSSLYLSIIYLKEKYTDEFQNENVFKFINEILFNPDIVDKAFKKDNFNRVKEILKENIKTYDEEAMTYAPLRAQELMDENNTFFYRGVGYTEDLNKITPEKLYDYYKDVISNDVVDVFITGDIDHEKLKELSASYLSFNSNKQSNIEFLTPNHLVKEKVLKETKDSNQSWLILGYKTDDLTKFEEEYIMSVYSVILGGGGSSKLFTNVREKHSLCYIISANASAFKKIILIRSGINAKDYDETLKLIKKEVDNMAKGKITKEELSRAKELLIGLTKKEDSNLISIRNQHISKYYYNHNLPEEDIKNFKKVKLSDITEFAKKVHLDLTYLLEGSSE